jgi:hypothetical protein
VNTAISVAIVALLLAVKMGAREEAVETNGNNANPNKTTIL